MPPAPTIPPDLTEGPFTVEQARVLGLTRRQLQGRSWRRLGAGTYAWAGLRDTRLLRLAAIQLRLPAGATFSGRTAAWLHGIDALPGDASVEVTVSRNSGVSGRVGVSIRRSTVRPDDVTSRQGLPATSMVRTLADLGQQLPLVESVIAVDRALHLGLVTLAQLDAWAQARRGSRGVVRFRRLIDLAEPASESPMESRLRLVLVLGRLPRPRAQVNLEDEAGRFLGRVDLYYPGARLAIEYDGADHRDRLTEDNRRQNGLLSAGFKLLRFAARDVLERPDDVVDRVRGALSSSP